MLNDINGYTRTCGLIGNPVEHTLSPVIHNTLSMVLGENLAYVPFHVENGRLEDAVKGAFALNLLGLNVTVPYKSDVIPYLTDIDPLAENIGAVNTLVRTETGYKGYNTDIIGLKKCFEERNIDISGKTVVLAGAGGAANSAAMLAGEEKAAKLVILNRTKEKAEKLAERVRAYYPIETEVLGYDEIMSIENPEIFVQTTSVGMGNDVDGTPVKNAEFFNNVKIVVDIIYTPWETRLMKDASAHGAVAVNGFDMLFYQGLASFEIWNDIKVDKELAVKLKNQLTDFYCGR